MVHRLGRRIGMLREARGMTQEQLARTVRLSRAYVARLETGRHNPPVLTLARIAKALQVPMADLFR
jgi:transcriptional regulator with XRE-family HTH domain